MAHDSPLRLAGRVCAASALAVGLSVAAGSSWLSATAEEPTSEPSDAEPSVSPSSPSPSEEPSGCSPSPSTLCCETSRGVYKFPEDSPLLPSLPSSVPVVDGFVCATLVATSPAPEPPKLDPVEPSASPEQMQSLLSAVGGLRSMLLFSAGLLTFLLAAIFMRTRP